MTDISKRVVFLVVAICAIVAALVVVFVRQAASQPVKNYEGYLAPVYSPDGQHVYFVVRQTRGSAKEKRTGDLFFRSSEYTVSVEKDTFSLNRLHVQSGQVKELIRLSP